MDPTLKEELNHFFENYTKDLNDTTNANPSPVGNASILKRLQVCNDFNASASNNLVEKLLQYREINQTFDFTADNYSFLNESRISADKVLEVDSSSAETAKAFRASDIALHDKQKTAKFLDPKLHLYIKKLNSKITLKGSRLNALIDKDDPVDMKNSFK